MPQAEGFHKTRSKVRSQKSAAGSPLPSAAGQCLPPGFAGVPTTKSSGQFPVRSFEGGGYLLSRFPSTIGVAGLNFPVRNGEGWIPRAMAALFFYFSFFLFIRISLDSDVCLKIIDRKQTNPEQSVRCVNLLSCITSDFRLTLYSYLPRGMNPGRTPESVRAISTARLCHH